MNTLSTGDETASPTAQSDSLFANMAGDISVSFEFFPPASETAGEQLWRAFDRLVPLGPSFVSMTYGAGGSTRDRSLDIVRRMAERECCPVAAHLTCVGASREEVDETAMAFWGAGIRHIVALRGDMPDPCAPFSPHPQGYNNAAELVAGLRALAPFEISVAAYPEVHPDAASAADDLDNLKRKLDAGADRALTQFFFSPDTFFRFRDDAAAAGITAPIVPGILPVASLERTRKFAQSCGASLPDWMEQVFAGLEEQPGTRKLVATTLMAEFCARLYDGGVRDFHFYTLNRAEMIEATCHLLGRRLSAQQEPAA